MKTKLWGIFILIFTSMLYLSACDNSTNPGIDDSLELFTGLELIPEAENSTLLINDGSDLRNDGYFSVKISNVNSNQFIGNIETEAWCLEWKKPLRSNNDTHEGVRMYSTSENEKWKPLNYFFSIRNELQEVHPEMTFREIQAVVWTLAGYMGIAPEFNVDKLPDNELPSDFRTNGHANFSKDIVKDISIRVLSNYSSSVVSFGGLALQTADDEQDIFIYPPSGITTNVVTDITATNAVSGGEIDDAGDSPITQKGVCWSTSANPTTDDSCTNDGTGSDDFVSNLSGLNPSTTYYVRAYAINEAGTAYGNQRSFMTDSADEVDRELNACGDWSASQSGGFGVTVDTWDISDIPVGATFDIRFNALTVPDKYVVEYPVGNEVLDTGWRGGSQYEGHPLYPGGIAGPGIGQELDIFQKGAQNTFRVTVTGAQQGTIWYYDMRCRVE